METSKHQSLDSPQQGFPTCWGDELMETRINALAFLRLWVSPLVGETN